MKLTLSGVMVDDQEKALRFYTEVAFKMPPTKAGPATIAVFDDTCGNLIQLYQV